MGSGADGLDYRGILSTKTRGHLVRPLTAATNACTRSFAAQVQRIAGTSVKSAALPFTQVVALSAQCVWRTA